MGLWGNLFSPNNWSEWVFGGALPVQAAIKTGKQRRQGNAQRDAQAAINQAEYEEQAAKGVERFRNRRRRGAQSTLLTGGLDSLGVSDKGNTLLGD